MATTWFSALPFVSECYVTVSMLRSQAGRRRTSPTWAMPPMSVPTMSSTMLASVQNCARQSASSTTVLVMPRMGQDNIGLVGAKSVLCLSYQM